MAGSDTRVGERTPTSMRIKLRYPDIDTFIQKYAVNISRGGIFIATKAPKPIGTLLKFEFLLASTEPGTSIIRGEGQVQWTREFDAAQPTKAHGMGVKFTKLDADSQEVVDRALAWRSAHQSGGTAVDDAPFDGSMRGAGVSTGSFSVVDGSPRPGAGVAADAPTEVKAKPEAPTPVATAKPAAAPPAIFDAPTPIRTLRSDGSLAAPHENGSAHQNGHATNGHTDATPNAQPNGQKDAQLDELAASWGISEAAIARTLATVRTTRTSAEAALTELEALRAKPTLPALSTADALAELRRFLG